jgi:hypothetical protein
MLFTKYLLREDDNIQRFSKVNVLWCSLSIAYFGFLPPADNLVGGSGLLGD